MAMNMGKIGVSNSNDEDFTLPIMAEINITPLTDVFLVLLIIFMVTSSVMSQMGIQVQLPQSKQASSSNQSPGVLVTVNSQNEIYVDGQRIDETSLYDALKPALDRSQDKTVVLEGDRKAVLGTIVKVMDEGKRAGALKFAVATQESGSSK